MYTKLKLLLANYRYLHCVFYIVTTYRIVLHLYFTKTYNPTLEVNWRGANDLLAADADQVVHLQHIDLLFNLILKNGEILPDWLISYMVTIHKSGARHW